MDVKNLAFWEEICGSTRFTQLGLKAFNEKNLDIFDKWYMNYYPYLYKYLKLDELKEKDVLEIGLGFGTVGEKLFQSSKSYTGIDNSQNPVDLMNQRIQWKKCGSRATSFIADALNLPFRDNQFDFVVSIGCLHHTGNLQKAINEVYRVLNDQGKALIMIYARNSFHRLILNRLRYIYKKINGTYHFLNYKEFERACYDTNSKDEAAPITCYTSKKEVKVIFSRFPTININTENIDSVEIPNTSIHLLPRKLLLNNIARLIGSDLYILACKG